MLKPFKGKKFMSDKIDINEKFQKALDLLENSKSHIFITGKAGTGKSTLLDHFRNKTNQVLVVLAPTGVAAVNVAGETIHSFFHFKPSTTPQDAKEIAKNYKNAFIYKKLDTIIIDEISMVRADLMDSIDLFLKAARKNDMPFGGVKMVFIGDLYQLPPVLPNHEKEALARVYPSPYFFSSHVIQDIQNAFNEIEYIELDKIYRQSDQDFIDILNNVRNKTATFNDLKVLNQRYSPDISEMSDKYVCLTSTNAQADDLNDYMLDKIDSDPHIFKGRAEGIFPEKDYPAEEELYFKKGSRVMFINNDRDDRWINGTVGTITELEGGVMVKIDNGPTVNVEDFKWEVYKTKYNEETQELEKEFVGAYKQLPLRLAWAITIHKSQGKTFDRVILDTSRGIFAHGQLYVALSRCRSLEGLILRRPLGLHQVIVDPRVIKFHKENFKD